MRVSTREYCGCCGRAVDRGYDFCDECQAHLLNAQDRRPWDRTYFAQHGKPCPLGEKP